MALTRLLEILFTVYYAPPEDPEDDSLPKQEWNTQAGIVTLGHPSKTA